MKEPQVWKGFFVLEGIDGSGTTTQLRRLEARAKALGLDFSITNEPTAGPVGVLIRRILGNHEKVTPGTLVRLFAADRHEHLYGPGGIRESLDKGQIVVSDRYVFSSLAYQTLNSPWEDVWNANGNFPLPEIVFFLDLDAEKALARVESRGAPKEIFENREHQIKVRLNYKKVMDFYKDKGCKIQTLDGSLSADILEEQIWDALKAYR